MIGLGLRLAVSGGREAVVRLVILAVAVGLGVGLLLTALSATSAVKAQNARHAWLWTGTASVAAGHAPAGTDPLWWSISGDEFGGQQIVRVDVAATGPTSPVPPGIPRDPAPGQYYASPALASLLRGTPADELADRYQGRLAGPIGDAALPSPNSLYIIVGRTAAQMARTAGTIEVTGIATALPGFGGARNPKGLNITPPQQGVGAASSSWAWSGTPTGCSSRSATRPDSPRRCRSRTRVTSQWSRSRSGWRRSPWWRSRSRSCIPAGGPP